MAQLIAVNGQLYCGRCNEMAEAQVDVADRAEAIWMAAKDARPEYQGPPRPGGMIDCLGCADVGRLVPYAVVTRMGIDVFYELIWAWLAALQGL